MAPSGRYDGEAISHGTNPHSGFRKDGTITTIVNSIAAIQSGYGNTASFQFEVGPGLTDSPGTADRMVNPIRTLLEQGSTLLNINIVDKD